MGAAPTIVIPASTTICLSWDANIGSSGAVRRVEVIGRLMQTESLATCLVEFREFLTRSNLVLQERVGLGGQVECLPSKYCGVCPIADHWGDLAPKFGVGAMNDIVQAFGIDDHALHCSQQLCKGSKRGEMAAFDRV